MKAELAGGFGLTDESFDERAVAAFLAAAIGDALGWPHESRNARIRMRHRQEAVPSGFEPWTRRAGGRFWGYEEQVLPGEYSDDTQLLLATARAICAGGSWVERFRKVELPAWLLYQRGGGAATKRAAHAWANSRAPWLGDRDELDPYFAAGGNGGAMRILPHVLNRSDDPSFLCRDVFENTISTHGHPRAILGALVYATALAFAIRKRGRWELGELLERVAHARTLWDPMTQRPALMSAWHSVEPRYLAAFWAQWEEAVHEVDVGLAAAQMGLEQGALAVDRELLQTLGAFNPKTSGAGTVTALAAIYLATRYAADPATGLLEAAFADGADTDTLASMVGALLGAMLGPSWLRRDWFAVQDASCIENTARHLSLGSPTTVSSALSSPVTTATNRELLGALEEGDQRVFTQQFGMIEVLGLQRPRSLTKSCLVTRWHLRTSEGQTVYVTKLTRSGPEHGKRDTKPKSLQDAWLRRNPGQGGEVPRQDRPAVIPLVVALSRALATRIAEEGRARVEDRMRTDRRWRLSLVLDVIERHGSRLTLEVGVTLLDLAWELTLQDVSLDKDQS